MHVPTPSLAGPRKGTGTVSCPLCIGGRGPRGVGSAFPAGAGSVQIPCGWRLFGPALMCGTRSPNGPPRALEQPPMAQTAYRTQATGTAPAETPAGTPARERCRCEAARLATASTQAPPWLPREDVNHRGAPVVTGSACATVVVVKGAATAAASTPTHPDRSHCPNITTFQFTRAQPCSFARIPKFACLGRPVVRMRQDGLGPPSTRLP